MIVRPAQTIVEAINRAHRMLGAEWLREGEAVKFVEVELKERPEPRKPAPERYPAIEIRLSQGRSLLVEPGFDASHLRALLAVLEAES